MMNFQQKWNLGFGLTVHTIIYNMIYIYIYICIILLHIYYILYTTKYIYIVFPVYKITYQVY